MDRYTKAVKEYLLMDDVRFKIAVEDDWNQPCSTDKSCLFMALTPKGTINNKGESTKEYNNSDFFKIDFQRYCCAIQIKNRGDYPSEKPYNKKIEKLVMDNPKIPNSEYGITKQNINEFAKLQRKIDKMFNRKFPKYNS